MSLALASLQPSFPCVFCNANGEYATVRVHSKPHLSYLINTQSNQDYINICNNADIFHVQLLPAKIHHKQINGLGKSEILALADLGQFNPTWMCHFGLVIASFS